MAHYDSTSHNPRLKGKPKPLSSQSPHLSVYKEGGRVGAKHGGGKDHWFQDATKGMRKDKPCTGKKFGSKTCPPGSKRYNLAKTFRSMNKKG